MRDASPFAEHTLGCNLSPIANSAAEGGPVQLSESKRKLDDVFRISQGEECASGGEITHSQKMECNIPENLEDSARDTTSTQQSDMECDEDSSDEDTESGRCRDPVYSFSNDDDSNLSNVLRRRCSGLCLRCVRRVGRAHIKPPLCIRKISPTRRSIICRSLIIIFMIVTIT